MPISRKIATWSFAVAVAGVTVAVIALQTSGAPVRAQLSGNTGLTPAQLTRLQRMQGRFAIEGELSRPEFWKSVETGTTGLDPAQARRTRAQLEQLLGPAPSVELALEAGSGASSLAIKEGRAKASAPATGEARALVPKGSRADAQPLQLSQKLEGAALLRVVEGKGFRQERRFSLSADASRLTLEVSVSGATLTAPLTASYVYRRL